MKAIETNEYKACDIVKCLTVLHNVTIDKEGMDQQLLSAVSNKVNNIEDNKMPGLKTGRRNNRSATEAINIRNCLKDYFISPDGSVPW